MWANAGRRDAETGAADPPRVTTVSELSQALGAAPPPELDVLTEQEQAALAELVTAAAQRRSELLDTAIDESLRHLPALVRGPVKRVLGV